MRKPQADEKPAPAPEIRPSIYSFTISNSELDAKMHCTPCKATTYKTGWEVTLVNEIEDKPIELRRYYVCSECGNFSTKTFKLATEDDKDKESES